MMKTRVLVAIFAVSGLGTVAHALPPVVPQVQVDSPVDVPPPAAIATTLTNQDKEKDKTENNATACTDGIDNDGDGDVDCADKDCRYVFACSKAARRSHQDAVEAQSIEAPQVGRAEEPIRTKRSDMASTGRLQDPQSGQAPTQTQLNLGETPTPLVDASELQRQLQGVDTGGNGQNEMIGGTVASVVAAGLLLGSIPEWVHVNDKGQYGGQGNTGNLPAATVMTVFGVGSAVLAVALVKNGQAKRASYHRTERLLNKLGAIPQPVFNTATGTYGAVSTVRF